jgi:hypothetical protein
MPMMHQQGSLHVSTHSLTCLFRWRPKVPFSHRFWQPGVDWSKPWPPRLSHSHSGPRNRSPSQPQQISWRASVVSPTAAPFQTSCRQPGRKPPLHLFAPLVLCGTTSTSERLHFFDTRATGLGRGKYFTSANSKMQLMQPWQS